MNSCQKGKRGEREAAEALRLALGIEARRGVQFCGGPDSPDVVGWQGVHLEVKRTERLDVASAYEQARAESRDDEVPVVLHRRNRTPWLAVVAVADLRHLAVRVAACSQPTV